MKNEIILIMMFVSLTCTVMASSGSFGEVAGVLYYNALIRSPQTHTWTLVNNFNTTLPFYIVKPSIQGVTLSTSVMNGTIQQNSYFPINVTILSNTDYTESGYITAYTGSNNTGNSGSSGIKLGTTKLIQINGTSLPPATTTVEQTTAPTTIASESVHTPTTVPQQVSQSGSEQSSGSNPSNSASSLLIPAIGIVLAIVIGVGIGIMFSRRGSGKPKQ
jgi:hypothetical protein